jgi:hypothetical protein
MNIHSCVSYSVLSLMLQGCFAAVFIGLSLGGASAAAGPLFAQLGSGPDAAAVMILAALASTWTYSALRERPPH